MDSLNALAEQGAAALWRASWQGFVFAALVWLLCLAWRRIPNALRCLLWWLVCLKLVLALGPAVISMPVRTVAAGAPTLHPIEWTAVPFETVPSRRSISTQRQGDPASELEGRTPGPLTPTNPTNARPAIYLTALWLLGALFFGTVSMRPYLRMRRLAATSKECTDHWVLGEARRIGEIMGVRARPSIRIAEGPSRVLTLAGPSPAILFSGSVLQGCSHEEMRMVLAHEMAHLRRFDAWWGLLPQIAHIVFFFHPAAWLACREFDLAREAACDEAAISTLGARRDRYGNLLLKLGSNQGSALCAPSVSPHFRLLRRRITMLENTISQRARASRLRPLEPILAVLALGMALVSPVEGQSTPSTPAARMARQAATSATVPLTSHPDTATKKSAKTHLASKTKAVRVATTVIPLYNTSAHEAADVIRQILNLPASSGLASDDEANALVVQADDELTKRVVTTAKSIDSMSRNEVQPDESLVTRLDHIHYGQAANMAKVLHETFGPNTKSLRIAVDLRTNILVLSASPDKLQRMEAVVAHLDIPIDDAVLKTRVYPIRYARASEIVPLIDNAIRQPGAAQFDERTNSVIVTTTDSSFDEVRQLIQELDKQTDGNRPRTGG